MELQAAFKIIASVYGADSIDKLTRQLGEAARAEGEVVSAGQRLIQNLRDQVNQAGMSAAEYQRYQAALMGVGKEAGPLIQQLERMKAEQAAAAKAARDQADAERQAAAAEAAASASKERFLQQLRDQIATQGKTTHEILAYRAAQMGASAEAKPLIEQLAKAQGQLHGTGVSAAQTAAALRMVPAQMTDIATQLAGGQSPFLILLQQGGQLKDSFGGIGPMFTALAGMITLPAVAATAAAAALGGLGYAFIKGRDESAEFARTLALTGNAAGVTAGSLQAMAARLEASSTATIGTTKELLNGLVATGTVGPRAIEPMGRAMTTLKQLSGESSDKVVKDFASMEGGVAKWAAEHNKSYNFLTVAQYKYIADLEKQGEKEKAMAETASLLDAALKERAPNLGTLQKAWEGLGKAASWAWDKMMGLGREGTDEQALAELDKKIKEQRAFIAKGGRKGFFGESLSDMDEEQRTLMGLEADRSALYKRMADAKAKAAAQAADAEKNRIGIEREASGQAQAEEDAQRELRLAMLKKASAERINVLTLEQAKLDQQKNKGLIEEQAYAQAKLAIDQKVLAEKIRLAQQERAIEAGKSAVSKAEQTKKSAKLAGMDEGIAKLQAEAKAKGIAGVAADKTGVSEFETKMNTLGEQQAKLQFQVQWWDKYREKIDSAAAAQVQFDITSGKMRGLSEQQKTALIQQAEAVDSLALTFQRLKKAADFQTKTDELAAKLTKDKNALADLNVERELSAAAVELEKEGISRLNPAYDELIAKRREVLEQAARNRGDLFGGFAQGIKDYVQEGSNYFGQMRDVAKKALDGMSDALANWVTTGKLNFKDFARSVIADLVKIIAKQQIMNALAAVKSGGAGTWLQAAASAFGFAHGGSFEQGGRRLFASGDVIDTATPFRFASGGKIQNGLMGEAGPEAIMPLERGANGKLGVRATGAGGGGDVSIGSIVVQSDGGTSASDTTGQNAAQLGRLIGVKVREVIIQEKRPGGILAAA